MISPELIRRYPFFAGLDHVQTVALANLAEELSVEAGHYFFQENDTLDRFYLILEGAIAVVVDVPARGVEQSVADQLTGDLTMQDAILNTVEAGQVFAWSALIPPYGASAAAKSLSPCRVLSFDCLKLREIFETDHGFESLMIQKAAHIITDRLNETRLQLLSYSSS